MSLKTQMTIRHTIITGTFFCCENYLPATARNVTHKITPALLTNISQKLLSLHVTVLDNKAHETSASSNYTLLGTHPKYLGSSFWSNLHTKKPRNTQTYLGILISNHFANKRESSATPELPTRLLPFW